jgi:hypothetical protein
MVVPARRSPNTRRNQNVGSRAPRLSRVAVVAVGVGIAAAAGHDVAWADAGHSDSSGNSSAHSSSKTGGEPKKSPDGRRLQRDRSSTSSKTPEAGTAAEPAKPSATGSNSTAPQHDSTARAARRNRLVDTDGAGTTKSGSSPHLAVGDRSLNITPRAHLSITSRAGDRQLAAKPTALTTSTMRAASAGDATTTTGATTTPSDPEPLSPIAKIAALPGRIVNTVLQALDLTVSSTGPKSPLNFAPIDEALFAAFRRVEAAVGLDKTPVAQPVPPAETYDGPTTGKTPTVAQFLNAAAGEYVLGGTPGGLQPFTVDGKQMTSTNVLTGESAQVWVTPEKQVIIAYQGTTGGTNLLFNPLIAISQVVTDAQVIFTDTTPQAFTDSLAFEQQVEAEAAQQGFDKSDIFVTGHSLGGWEAEYVAQQANVGGIGFESPGINTTVEGNGVDSGFVNVETYGDTAAYLATDLPALQPFMPPYVPAGGSKPHYGSIVMIGDPDATTPLVNASSLWGTSLVGDAIFAVDVFGNFLEHHLPGMQAYNLGVSPDPGVVPWLGATMGPVEAGYGDMTIPELELAASQAGMLIKP